MILLDGFLKGVLELDAQVRRTTRIPVAFHLFLIRGGLFGLLQQELSESLRHLLNHHLSVFVDVVLLGQQLFHGGPLNVIDKLGPVFQKVKGVKPGLLQIQNCFWEQLFQLCAIDNGTAAQQIHKGIDIVAGIHNLGRQRRASGYLAVKALILLFLPVLLFLVFNLFVVVETSMASSAWYRMNISMFLPNPEISV